jgi:eukaryotic-like serine/threonine-protein kinase
MTNEEDIRIGQLALARGWLDLPALMRAVEESGRREIGLSDVFVVEGLLTSQQIGELRERIATTSKEILFEELELGNTIVLKTIADQTLQAERRTQPDSSQLLATLDGEPHSLVATSRSTTLGHLDLTVTGDRRYDFLDELGRGGMGQILRARDQVLNREIALKTLLPEALHQENSREQLILEAQVTGLLEHPSIVPIYDLGVLSSGEPYYTMRVVRERSLAQILDLQRHGSEEAFSLLQLVAILRQVCLAIQFAHDRGVIHRDLKPDNVLIGHYGEVFVIDWGVAKLVNDDIGTRSVRSARNTQMGAVIGTPHYMAPEQARGHNDEVDQRTDVYALGAILYEMLALKPMFEAEYVLQLLFKVVDEKPVPPSQRQPPHPVPTTLEEICLKALAKRPEDRYPSAQAMADELNLFLEGVKERERQREQAEIAMRQAFAARARYEEIRHTYSAVLNAVAQCRQQIPTWASSTDKERLWSLEQESEALLVDIERHFGETVRLLGQSLGHYDLSEARAALTEMYWQRFIEAEATGQHATAAYFENLVRQHNDGSYDTLLEGHGELTVTTDSGPADLILYRYENKLHRLVETFVCNLGPSPIEQVSLPHGSYLLEITPRDSNLVPLRVPVVIGRLKHTRLMLRLYERSRLPDGFVIIPGGEFLSGRLDILLEDQRLHLDDFAIQSHPVTCAQYLEFLNAIAPTNLDEALRHAPRIRDDADSYFPLTEEGEFVIPQEDADGDAWDRQWPICMVNLAAAQAYATWRSRRDGRNYRLPTSEEWEKVARGVDGRLYPWGNVFDPIFCHMRESRPGRAFPAPVGSYPTDRSPYGVYDTAGNICEWTTTLADQEGQTYVIRGGCYGSFALICRLDWYQTSPAGFRPAHYGFRLALDL